jgi:hypothetical protein
MDIQEAYRRWNVMALDSMGINVRMSDLPSTPMLNAAKQRLPKTRAKKLLYRIFAPRKLRALVEGAEQWEKAVQTELLNRVLEELTDASPRSY